MFAIACIVCIVQFIMEIYVVLFNVIVVAVPYDAARLTPFVIPRNISQRSAYYFTYAITCRVVDNDLCWSCKHNGAAFWHIRLRTRPNPNPEMEDDFNSTYVPN